MDSKKRVWEPGFTKYSNGRIYMGALDFGKGCRGFMINEDGSWETSYYKNSLQSGATIDRNSFSLTLRGRQIFVVRGFENENRMSVVVEWGDNRWSMNIGLENGTWFINHPLTLSKNGLGYSGKKNAICKYNYKTGFDPIIPDRKEFKFQGVLSLPRKADKPSSSSGVSSIVNVDMECLYSNCSKGLCMYYDKKSLWKWYGEASYYIPGGFGVASKAFGSQTTFNFGCFKKNEYGTPYIEEDNRLYFSYYDYDSYSNDRNYLKIRKAGDNKEMTFILYKNGSIKFQCGEINGSYVELEDFDYVTLVEVKDNKIVSRTKYNLQ